MVSQNGHPEAAFKHLITALWERGIVITRFSMGHGVPAGLIYTIKNTQTDVAHCNFPGGLDIDAALESDVALLIRSHNALFYYLFPIND
jgi:hypothetical protein